jgi:hypothetical protein
MPKIIDIPGHGRVEFPDSMSDAQISQAIQTNILKQPPARLSASDVATQAISNLPESFGNLVGGLYQAVTSPLQTGKAVLDVAAGGLQNILPERLVQAIGEDKASRDMANKVGQMYVERYGGVENAKRTIANDPAGFMADVSTALTGVGGVVPKAGKLAAAVDPLSLAVKGTGAVVSGGSKLAAQGLGVSTGAGAEAITQAFRAGRSGGQAAQEFKQNMRGEVPVSDVLDVAKQNLADMNAAKQAEYRSGMVNIKNDKTVLDFAGIDKALLNAQNRTVYKGKVINQKAAEDVAEVRRIVDDWKRENPTEYHTPEGMDALKRRVGDVLDGIPFEQKNANAAVQNVYNSIKSEITKQAPTYSRVMKNYSESTEQIREIERALSLGNKASADTGVRKLQSLMRNNANTNYGFRKQLAEQLTQAGGRDIMPSLSGQALSEMAPRGLQRAAAIPTSLGAFSLGGFPTAIGALMASSPRLVGEATYGAGVAGRGVDMIPPSLLDPRLYNILYQSGNVTKNRD